MNIDTVELIIDRSLQENEEILYLRNDGVIVKYKMIQDTLTLANMLMNVSMNNNCLKQAILLVATQILDQEE